MRFIIIERVAQLALAWLGFEQTLSLKIVLDTLECFLSAVFHSIDSHSSHSFPGLLC